MTRAQMERRSIDVLLVTDPANLYYLTGYVAWSFYVGVGRQRPARFDGGAPARSGRILCGYRPPKAVSIELMGVAG